MRSVRLAHAIAVLAVGLLASGAHASNGPMPSTVGTKGPVSTPVDGDGQTMFRMPSSIAWSFDHRIDLDLFLVYTHSEMRNSLNDFDEGYSTFGGSLGFVFAPGRPELTDEAEDLTDATADVVEESVLSRFTLGLGVYPDIAGGGGPKDKVRLTTFPDFVGVRKSLSFLTAALDVTFRPTRWLGLGLGLHVISAEIDTGSLVGGNSTPLDGSPTINGVPFPGNPTYADFLGLFASTGATDPTSYFDAELSCIQFSATLSLSLRPFDQLGIGFSYRERSWAPTPFEGTARISAERTFQNALGGLTPAIRDLFLQTLPDQGARGFVSKYDAELDGVHVPRQVRMSVAFWPIDRLLLSAEVAWIEWHRAFGTASVRLSKGTNNDLNFVVGSTSINSRQDTRWSNTWIFSTYAAFGVTDSLTARLGLSFGESPLNEDRQDNVPSAGYVSTTVSAGVGWRLSDSVELNLLLEYAPPTSRKSDDSAQSLTAKKTTYTSDQFFAHVGVAWRF
jgi:long-subunit fatty acid transport protein